MGQWVKDDIEENTIMGMSIGYPTIKKSSKKVLSCEILPPIGPASILHSYFPHDFSACLGTNCWTTQQLSYMLWLGMMSAMGEFLGMKLLSEFFGSRFFLSCTSFHTNSTPWQWFAIEYNFSILEPSPRHTLKPTESPVKLKAHFVNTLCINSQLWHHNKWVSIMSQEICY